MHRPVRSSANAKQAQVVIGPGKTLPQLKGRIGFPISIERLRLRANEILMELASPIEEKERDRLVLELRDILTDLDSFLPVQLEVFNRIILARESPGGPRLFRGSAIVDMITESLGDLRTRFELLERLCDAHIHSINTLARAVSEMARTINMIQDSHERSAHIRALVDRNYFYFCHCRGATDILGLELLPYLLNNFRSNMNNERRVANILDVFETLMKRFEYSRGNYFTHRVLVTATIEIINKALDTSLVRRVVKSFFPKAARTAKMLNDSGWLLGRMEEIKEPLREQALSANVVLLGDEIEVLVDKSTFRVKPANMTIGDVRLPWKVANLSVRDFLAVPA